MIEEQAPKSIAVIGAGVAGVVSAYLLSKKHRVCLFEANNRLGGHTHTIPVTEADGRVIPVDTGFIVMNDRTYPLFHKFLSELQVSWRYSDMSFGYWSPSHKLYYSGSGVAGLFARKSNVVRPSFYRFIFDLQNFGKKAVLDLESGKLSGITLSEYVKRMKLGSMFVDHFLVPMAASIWSATEEDIWNFPAETLLQFYKNHGLLFVDKRPKWQTVVGGSSQYLHAFRRSFDGQIFLGAKVQSVTRDETGAELHFSSSSRLENLSSRRFDAVVFATHANQSYKMLSDPTREERRLLEPWKYSSNTALLHRDVSIMPPSKDACASWNYFRDVDVDSKHAVTVSYHMNRLQGFDSSAQYFVTLNPIQEIDQKLVEHRLQYFHPRFTPEAVRTQTELPSLDGKLCSYFCGSYHGYGFHEDAVRSAVRVANSLGVKW